MAAKTERFFRSWIVAYVAFVIALVAAGTGSGAPANSSFVSPGSYPAGFYSDKAFFLPTLEQNRRTDI
ncbi:MAG: hypothetical protein IIB75_06785 [Proteobacteria bacterium]|nr:hypothetical protein [Pseudomonadota bacterium]